MDWISINEKDKLEDGKYLVNKKYEWQRHETKGVYYEIQILTFNSFHECWDDESGDDYYCDIDRVTHFMKLPEQPILNSTL